MAFVTGEALAGIEPFAEPEDAELFGVEEVAVELDPMTVKGAADFMIGDALAELEPFAESEPFTLADAELFEEAAVELDPTSVEEAVIGEVELEAVEFEEAAALSETVNCNKVRK